MAQLFPRVINRLPLLGALLGAVVPLGAIGFVWYYFSPRYTDVGYAPVQPVPYSHKLHAGDMGIDCRYCHASVETSPVANIPPTQTCMNCHKVVMRDSPALAPIRESAQTGKPMRWVRVHELPDFAYFEHRAHVNAGIGCVSCHGHIEEMEVVRQEQPLSMSWCLDCHRDPTPHLRPRSEITNMKWTPPRDEAARQRQVAEMLKARPVNPPKDCSGCHR